MAPMTQPTLTRKVRLNKRSSFCSATSADERSKPITRYMPMPRAASCLFFVSLTQPGPDLSDAEHAMTIRVPAGAHTPGQQESGT